MSKIHITTFINAPVERVFDLSRNITLLKKSILAGKEQILTDTSSVLIGKGESITWKAKHFGKLRMLTTRVVEMEKPGMYQELQVKGDLKSYSHEHHFKKTDNGTIMIDMVEFEGPRDIIGSIAAPVFLKKYLEAFIQKKNELIRQYAESDKWRAIIG